MSQKIPDIDIVTIVLNGEPYIEHCIKQYYKYARNIFIIEGADNRTRDHVNHKFFTDSGHSTDRTVEIIRSFPDPEHKIQFFQKDGFWENGKEEMIMSTTSDKISSNWVWVIDYDEFVRDCDFEKVFKMIEEKNPTAFCFPMRSFWNNFNTMFGWENQETFSPQWGEAGWRLHRWDPGFSHWITVRPPNTTLKDGRSTWDGAIGPEELAKNDCWLYHYSDVFDIQNEQKSGYYEYYVPGHPELPWFEHVFLAWKKDPKGIEEKYGIVPKFGKGKTMKFFGEHPSEIYEMCKRLGIKIKTAEENDGY